MFTNQAAASADLSTPPVAGSPLRATAALAPVPLSEVPQWYRAGAATAAASHPLLAELVAACRARWGTADLAVDCQVLDLRPGSAPGLPVWRALLADAGHEVALACLSGDQGEPLAEVAAELPRWPDAAVVDATATVEPGATLLPADQLCFLAPGTPLRFRIATRAQPCLVALVRPAAGLPPLDHPRFCARVFSPAPEASALTELPAWAARRTLRFATGFSVVAALPAFSQRQIADEPLLASASPAFARAHGGPITQAWLDRLPPEWHGDDVLLAVKRDELSPGWWPALLAWHLDGTSRAAKRADGTPDLVNPVRRQDQIAACVGPAAPTALLSGTIDMPEVPLGTPQGHGGSVWSRLLHEAIADGTLRPGTVPTDTVFAYPWGGFHACSRAAVPGWRLFLKGMSFRGEQPRDLRPARSTIAWALDCGEWPDDPCGVFPQQLPW